MVMVGLIVVAVAVIVVVMMIKNSQAELAHTSGSLADSLNHLKLISEATEPMIHSPYAHRDQESQEGGPEKNLAHLPRV